MIKLYRDLWQKRSELLSQLTALTSKNVKYNWKDKHQKCFDAIKDVIGREVLNGLSFFLYGHNTVTSDVITQLFKSVGTKALLSDFDLEPSLLESGKHLFGDSNIFCSRAFCDMKKIIDIHMYGI